MTQQRILHICIADKFVEPFIKFINNHFDGSDHEFVIFGGDIKTYPIQLKDNIWFCNGYSKTIKLVIEMQYAQKIIIHGLFNYNLIKLLARHPWLLKKCYWVMWGGDLYWYQHRPRTLRWDLREYVRRFVIQRIGHFITHVKGDYELACKWYGATGKWHECFMYPSNLYYDYTINTIPHRSINILVGNSATESNNHIQALEKLHRFVGDNVRIYCPLSYGNSNYAQKVADYGKDHFGDKFVALRDFMPFDKYLELLAQIDIAIFNHNRQQGMGNITSLIGMGKKVYMRSNLTSWETFKKLGIQIYDIDTLSFDKINDDIYINNKRLVAEYFSIDNLIRQWNGVFNTTSS